MSSIHRHPTRCQTGTKPIKRSADGHCAAWRTTKHLLVLTKTAPPPPTFSHAVVAAFRVMGFSLISLLRSPCPETNTLLQWSSSTSALLQTATSRRRIMTLVAVLQSCKACRHSPACAQQLTEAPKQSRAELGGARARGARHSFSGSAGAAVPSCHGQASPLPRAQRGLAPAQEPEPGLPLLAGVAGLSV